MAGVKEYLFVLIVSGEFLALIVGAVLGFVWTEPLAYLGSKLNTSDKVLCYSRRLCLFGILMNAENYFFQKRIKKDYFRNGLIIGD